MVTWLIVGAVLALGVGIYVGLGLPGVAGREDRVVQPGRARRGLEPNYIHWLRPKRR